MNAAIKNRGFTLVELSIVLVIMGLIVGGITAGASLVRSSRLQSAIGEVDDYKKAILAFKDQYQAFPGDMANAESIWGSDTGCPSTTYTTTAHITTCNGNGDGFIGNHDSTAYSEEYRAWQQLSSAKLLKGEYVGMSGGGSTNDAILGINVPKSKIKGAGYSLGYLAPTAGSTSYLWPSNYGHILYFGSKVTNGNMSAQLLSPDDAYAIDAKIDDGQPAFGIVMSAPSGAYPNCTTSDNASASKYDFSKKETNCALLFLLGF